MSETELARARAMKAMQDHLLTLEGQVEQLICEVEALRLLLDREKTHQFERLVAEIRQRAEKAAAQAETNERLRQIAEDAKGPKS